MAIVQRIAASIRRRGATRATITTSASPESPDQPPGSVGSSAPADAELACVAPQQPENQQRQEKLSVILRSLGEGVCAVSEEGEITFMNPAGASMLGWYTLETDADGPAVLLARRRTSCSSRPCGPSRCDATSPATTRAFDGSTDRTSRSP